VSFAAVEKTSPEIYLLPSLSVVIMLLQPSLQAVAENIHYSFRQVSSRSHFRVGGPGN
jgi:hypothetical protein